MPSRHESRLVGLALEILRETVHPTFKADAQGRAVQLALRVLQPYAQRHNLMTFWLIAGQEAGGNRDIRMRKVFEVIEAVALRRLAGL